MAGDCVVLDEERRSRCRHPCMTNGRRRWSEGAHPAQGVAMTTRTCGFAFTTTGRPCANLVADGVAVVPGRPSVLAGRGRRPDRRCARRHCGSGPMRCPAGPSHRGARARRPGARTRRATELIRQAMASEDADEVGLRAETVLGRRHDRLGTARRARRLAQRPAPRSCSASGGSGALLVLGYEERGRARHPGRRVTTMERAERPEEGRRPHRGPGPGVRHNRRRAASTGSCARSTRTRVRRGRRTAIDAHRWLHATYAVAARDGTAGCAPRLHVRAGPGHAPRQATGRLLDRCLSAGPPGRASGLSGARLRLAGAYDAVGGTILMTDITDPVLEAYAEAHTTAPEPTISWHWPRRPAPR